MGVGQEDSVYVAGGMRGFRHFNFEAFDAARDYLRAKQWRTLSPADHDRDMGFDAIALDLAGEDADLVHCTFDMKDAIMWDLNAVADSDAIYLLRGWQNSKGARLERALADFLSKRIIEEQDGDFRAWS